MAIPIKNIYYLLLYAWDSLDEGDLVSVKAEEQDMPQDLFAQILVNGIQRLVRMGIHQDYIRRTEETPVIRGKLLIDQSLKSGSFNRAKAVCAYDEFCADTIPNQIVKSTVKLLIRVKRIDSGLKDELRNLFRKMSMISDVPLNNRLFNSANIHRNNRFYRFLISICHLIYENTSLISENSGEVVFRDFIRDEEKMNSLFEKFVRNFYRKKLKGQFAVSGERMSWKAESPDEKALGLLPEMLTDITLTPSHGHGPTLIIDTKYYANPLGGGKYSEKVHSGNLYQMYSYLSNKRAKDGTIARGVLLYASTGENLSLYYPVFHDFSLRVESLNLNEDWMKIEESLINLTEVENQAYLAQN